MMQSQRNRRQHGGPRTIGVESLLHAIRSLRADLTAQTAAGGSLMRRGQPRVGLRLRMTILPLGGRALPPGPDADRATHVHLRNLSPRGVGFVHDRVLEEGRHFLIELPRERGGNAHLLGCVERCRRIETAAGASPLYDIGGSLDLGATADDIRQLRGERKSA
jgi:hypothetical protein